MKVQCVSLCRFEKICLFPHGKLPLERKNGISMEKYSNNDDSKQSRAMMSAFRIELIFRFMTPLSSRD